MTALVEYPWPGNVRELENVIERLVVNARREIATPDDLPPEVRQQRGVSLRPKRERRRTVADDLYKRIREEQESFWTAVYPLYMQREITKDNVRDLGAEGPRRSARQLQDRREALQHGAARLQEVFEFPEEA